MESTEVVNKTVSLMDKGKLFLKIVIIFFMALALWLPTHLILEVIRERESRQKEAITDISSKWADEQTVTGPVLVIPYYESGKDEKGNVSTTRKNAYFLPGKNEITSNDQLEKRHRGIYEVVVYRSETHMNIRFNPLPWRNLKIPAESILWNEAALVFSVSDNLKGINEDFHVNWDGRQIIFNPQPPGFSEFKGGFIAPVELSAGKADTIHIAQMKFNLNGSSKLLFTMNARENKMTMHSSWPNPSFTGVKLPDLREVQSSGFTAHWQYMNRAVPLVWKDNFYDLSSSVIGADLLITVDSYDKTERSVKYALLCILLTFAVFFLVETIYQRPLHLIHYGLAGLALVLFYSLLLSVSEYTGFNLAYLVAGLATVVLVTWFIGSLLKSVKLAFFIGFVLTVVYSYIFTIIQLQDYALLMGSIGLFIALAIIMYFVKRVQW